MIIDLNVIDTHPGAVGPHALLAPPSGFTGSEEEYREWIRERYYRDMQVTQVMYLVARRVAGLARNNTQVVEFVGPYANEMERIIKKIGRDMRSKSLRNLPD